MKEFQELYNRNKELDKMFYQKYGNNEDIINKNKLELLVELGELANETRCFKYWSVKKADKDKVLEEYADVLLMILYFFNILKVSLDEPFPKSNKKEDILEKFAYLFKLSSHIREECNKEIMKEIFVNFLELGNMLNITTKEIITSCDKKITINKKRFEIEY